MFSNKPHHFSISVEGVGFSHQSLAVLGWRGFSIELAVQSQIRNVPSGIGIPNELKKNGKEKKRFLFIRVTFNGRSVEHKYSLAAIEHSVTAVGNFIASVKSSKVSATILSSVTRSPTAKQGPIHTKDSVSSSPELKISAKMKD